MRARVILLAALAAVLLPLSSAGATAEALPTIRALVPDPTGNNGWYVENTTVEWQVDGETDSRGCDTTTISTDTPGTEITCEAWSGTGPHVKVSVTIQLDKMPPVVTAATPDRAPDANGWHNHPVGFTFTANGGTSGLDSCTPVTYSGPDRRSAAVRGVCRDMAGNVGSKVFSGALDYDSTPPSAKVLRKRSPDSYGWYGRPIRFRWTGGDELSGIAGCSRKRYSGPNTDAVRLVGHCRDNAGNVRNRGVRLRYSNPLLMPRNGSTQRRPPLLDWVAVGRAKRYNVQLWKGSEKLLSRWPYTSRYQLDKRWSYAGQKRVLGPGKYTTYVWPLLKRGYGKEIAHTTFVVP